MRGDRYFPYRPLEGLRLWLLAVQGGDPPGDAACLSRFRFVAIRYAHPDQPAAPPRAGVPNDTSRTQQGPGRQQTQLSTRNCGLACAPLPADVLRPWLNRGASCVSISDEKSDSAV